MRIRIVGLFLGLCCAMASAQTSPAKTEGAKNESDSTLARNGWFVYAPYGKPNPQSPIPNPQSPIPKNIQKINLLN